ncbi:phage upper tail fiber protein [Rhizobium sp. L80/93]|uniref:phage upper tail fiber protein n=1 Tax=unclassified Rhizobium TaxID=2613769 RepID=UPI001ADC28A8|nr:MULTISPECIES: hypothetical protein [unclassified Rhizobium]MBO9136905.1 hypothetical protein [Rhizobium sp. B209b/85]MBO9186804.1 hypothetical protein [Rhizobium sp. E27B/91]QXZ99095.1 hypothetical protein J5289_21660 [Rhizobium sp. B230/85]
MNVYPPTEGPNSVSPITVNGRTYTPVVGRSQTVPDQDGLVLTANGWTKHTGIATVQITQAQYNALTSPDPNTLYAIVG